MVAAMGEALHEFGAKASGLAVEDGDRVGPSVEDGLRAALNLLAVFPIATVVRFDQSCSEPRVAARVDLYRLRVGTVLPVGLGDVAGHVRALLGAEFDGWVMPPPEADPVPLQSCEGRLPVKVVNVLRRRQFRTVAEVALVPDEALLKLGGMGPTLLARLREVIPAAGSESEIAASGGPGRQGVEGDGWVGAGGLLARLGQLTSSLSGVVDREAGADPAARAGVAAGIAALQAELATFAATNLGPRTPGDGQACEPAVWCGNAADDGAGHGGWFVGHFLEMTAGVRASEDVELKWGQHSCGERRDDWALGDRRSTLTVLVAGGPWRVQLPEREHTLARPGDYLLFGPGLAHAWQADGDTTMLTIRWPSRP